MVLCMLAPQVVQRLPMRTRSTPNHPLDASLQLQQLAVTEGKSETEQYSDHATHLFHAQPPPGCIAGVRQRQARRHAVQQLRKCGELHEVGERVRAVRSIAALCLG